MAEGVFVERHVSHVVTSRVGGSVLGQSLLAESRWSDWWWEIKPAGDKTRRGSAFLRSAS